MENELFYTNLVQENKSKKKLISIFQDYSSDNFLQVFILTKPLSVEEEYDYKEGCFLLIPKFKIIFIDFNNDSTSSDFEDYIDDILDDLGYVSDKFKFKDQLKRPRYWKKNLINRINYEQFENLNLEEILEEHKLNNEKEKRDLEIIISLLTGSINDSERIKGEIPNTILEKIKKKIIIFDGQQSRFLYQEPKKNCIKIQGLAGTGKTELLLHKLKNIYLKNPNIKIAFTCYNKILHDTLNKRIPEFFDFMKVEEQIKWNEKLWCCRGWGSKQNHNIGLYSFICNYYNLTFYSFRENQNFSSVCQIAIDELEKKKYEPFFDYILVDESQDFPQSFFELCKKVTKNTVYLAGDIFQNIFNTEIESSFDFLLNKCYRTDPKTLMFAHALGMGLFEEKRISWLSKQELEACGYLVKEEEDNYILTRKPLKRFEELEIEKIKTIELIKTETNQYINKILEIIKEIKEKNSTVIPDDIVILFLKNNSQNYEFAEKLKWRILSDFGWECNIGYETHKKVPNTIMLTNKNNIKGLEYPFVICLVETVTDSITERNAIYMMLTRSFLTSYLILNNTQTELIEILEKGLDEIYTNDRMIIKKPTLEEEQRIKSNIIKYKKGASLSLEELILKVMSESNIEMKYKKLIEEFLNVELDFNSYENEEAEKMIHEFIAKLRQ